MAKVCAACHHEYTVTLILPPALWMKVRPKGAMELCPRCLLALMEADGKERRIVVKEVTGEIPLPWDEVWGQI